MRWFIIPVLAIVAGIAGINIWIEQMAETQPEALRFADGFWFTVWAVLGGFAWAPGVFLALYFLLRSPAGRNRGGEG